MKIADRLAREREARLAAEGMLAQKTQELALANKRLSRLAPGPSGQSDEQRQVVTSALTEGESLNGQTIRFHRELDRAHTLAGLAERRLWESINTLRDGFAVFNADHKLVVANRAYVAAFKGRKVEPGVSYAEVVRLAAESGAVDLAGQSPEDWQTMMIARWDRAVIPPITIKFLSGVWVKLVEKRTVSGDVVTHALDITERMRVWAAIEAIPDGFVLYDREDRLLICNQRYREIYAQSAPAMVPGTKFEDILRHGLAQGQHMDAIGREADWLAERMEQHRNPVSVHEQRLGDGRWLRAHDHPTPDGGRVGLRVDISESKSQQAALETARIAAEAANHAKSAFLANMSHEIRTPMNGVVGMAELLCDTDLTEDQRLFAETIRSSGEALLVIINDILDYSKIEAERLTLHPEPFDLERTIHEVAMLMQPRAHAKGIDLMIDFDMFLPTRYIGDPGRLRQVLTNLIGNAVKFTESGHVLIRVVGLEVDADNQQLHVTVEDTGIGIAASNLGHVFGEFNQVESQTNRKFEGTGLGLAITQKLIERMGGAVWVDSDLGKGSSFGFRLTLAVAEDDSVQQTPIDLRRALVVDDQFINRIILERQLVPCGIAVTLCRSGAEALAVLDRDHTYDVVITDHDMPNMDGIALAEQIQARGLSVPIMLLSSNPAARRDQTSLTRFAAVLQKPVLRSELYRRLKSLSAPVAPIPMAVLPTPRPTGARAMRVLAAEDNRTNQLVFRKMVKDIDIDLTFATNGREAVELYQSLKPDLIFMDISMPEMDGCEAAATIRALEAGSHGRIPIVALTAHAMYGDSASIFAAGIDRYMTKPLRKSAIKAVLAEFCPKDARPILLDEALTGT